MRRIYLMTDHYSSSLWADEPEHGMISLEGLPLDGETKRALQAWSPPAGDTLSEHERREEGLRLWRVVQEQLGPDYEVGLATFRSTGPYDAEKLVIWNVNELQQDVSVG